MLFAAPVEPLVLGLDLIPLALAAGVLSGAISRLLQLWRRREGRGATVSMSAVDVDRLREAAETVHDELNRPTVDTEAVQDAAEEIERRAKAVVPEPSPTGRALWAKDIAVALIATSGVVGVAVINNVLDEPAPLDCVAYVRLLADLDAEGVDVDVFGTDGLEFGDIEDECGPPEAMFEP